MCLKVGNPCINSGLVCILTTIKYVPNGYISTFTDGSGKTQVVKYAYGGAYCSDSELNWLAWVIISVGIVVIVVIVLVILCCCGCMACCCTGC